MRLWTSEHWARSGQLWNYYNEYKGEPNMLAYGVIIDKDSPIKHDNYCTWYEGADYSSWYYTFMVRKSEIDTRWNARHTEIESVFEDRPSDKDIVEFIARKLIDRFLMSELKNKDITFMLVRDNGELYQMEGEKEWKIEA